MLAHGLSALLTHCDKMFDGRLPGVLLLTISYPLLTHCAMESTALPVGLTSHDLSPFNDLLRRNFPWVSNDGLTISHTLLTHCADKVYPYDG